MLPFSAGNVISCARVVLKSYDRLPDSALGLARSLSIHIHRSSCMQMSWENGPCMHHFFCRGRGSFLLMLTVSAQTVPLRSAYIGARTTCMPGFIRPLKSNPGTQECGHAFLSKLSVLIRDQHEAQSVHACSTLRKKIRSRKASWILSWCRAHNAALKLAQVPTTVSSSQNSIVPYTMPTVLLFRIPYYLSVSSVCCIVDKNRITINTASAFSANVQVVPVDDIHSA